MSQEASKEQNPNLNKFQKFFYNYGRFHYNPINIIVHIIFVPLITLTLDRMIALSAKDFGMTFNPCLILFAILAPIYIYVDFASGLITSIQYPLLSFLTKDIHFSLFGLSDLKTSVILHVFSWIMQFLGHGAFEKRKPALLDNIFLVFNAPVFVNIELMNFLFKYKDAELEETKRHIEQDIALYRKSKGIKSD